jgi:hypothetical protein
VYHLLGIGSFNCFFFLGSSIGDSLDLVPIAAFHGRGKRTGVYGSFLLACYDEQNEEYQTICNIGTGFSEQQLEERSVSLRTKAIPKPKVVHPFSLLLHDYSLFIFCSLSCPVVLFYSCAFIFFRHTIGLLTQWTQMCGLSLQR